MASNCVDGVLPARPDIEGIGTRIATYAQVFLAIFTIALTPAARSFDAWWAVLVTSLGLQAAAIAQRHGLTLFHALVVTLLAFPIFAMSWVYIFLHWREEAMPPEILIATHIHGFLFVAFGLWIWATAPTFGTCPELNSSMQYVIFGKSVDPLGWIRPFFLVVYSIWGLAFLIAATADLLHAIPSLRAAVSRRWSRFSTSHAGGIAELGAYLPGRYGVQVFITSFNLSVLAYGIWSVESMLARNVVGSSRAAESSLTFGQLAAIILLVGPLFTFVRLLRFKFLGKDAVGGRDREGMPLTSPTSRMRRRGANLGTEDEKDGRKSSVRDLLNKSDSGGSA